MNGGLLFAIGIAPTVISWLVAWYAPVTTWYRVPTSQPPGFVFAVVWTVLYAAMGIVTVFVILADCAPTATAVFLTLHASQMLLSFYWPIAFFRLRRAHAAISIINTMTCLVAAMGVVGICYIAWWTSVFCVPYVAWLIFAANLTAEVVASNETTCNP